MSKKTKTMTDLNIDIKLFFSFSDEWIPPFGRFEFTYLAKSQGVFPGGFGTMGVFEVMALTWRLVF